jgi:hypothetical protein
VVYDGADPVYEVAASVDPSDVVKVTPAQLVNRNAPGSTSLRNPTVGAMNAEKEPTVVRRDAGGAR